MFLLFFLGLFYKLLLVFFWKFDEYDKLKFLFNSFLLFFCFDFEVFILNLYDLMYLNDFNIFIFIEYLSYYSFNECE